MHLRILHLPNLSYSGLVTFKVPVCVVIHIKATALKLNHSKVDYWVIKSSILKAPDSHEGFVVIESEGVIIYVGVISWVAISEATLSCEPYSEHTGFIVSDLEAANNTSEVGIQAITFHKADWRQDYFLAQNRKVSTLNVPRQHRQLQAYYHTSFFVGADIGTRNSEVCCEDCVVNECGHIVNSDARAIARSAPSEVRLRKAIEVNFGKGNKAKQLQVKE